MAPTGTKAEAWLEKERIIGSRYSRRPRSKRSEPQRRKQTYQSTDIQKLVHRLLNVGKHNQGTKNKKLTPSEARWLQNLPRKYQEYIESQQDKTKSSDNSASPSESEGTDAISPSEMMDVTNSARSSSSRSIASHVSQRNNAVPSMTLAQSIENMRSLLRREPVVQIINSCFKAGVEEGKRRAEKYVRNVLSFGLSSGYLIPGDLQAPNRISPRVLESKRADAESRLRRRRERRGEDVPPNVKRKDLRRGTSTCTTAKSKAPGDDSTDVAKKRGRKSKSSSPRTGSNTQGTSKAEKRGSRQGRKDEQTTKRKPAKKKRSQYRREKTRDESASSSRRARSKSNRDRASENRTSVKSPANETNQRIDRERLRSFSRSKSIPPQSRVEEQSDSVEKVDEQRRLGGTCCECEECQIIGNDA